MTSTTRVCAAAIAVGGILTAACGAEPVVPEPAIRPVRFEQVFATGGQRTRTFSGVARAGVEQTLSFRVPGTVAQVDVEIGDRVQAGQLLAQLDPVDYELQVKEAEAALRQAEAQAGNAAADLERVRGLYENSNASVDDLDAAKAAAASAEAQVEAISKRLELAGRQVAYTRLAAPVTGAVADVRVETNENVGAGQIVVVLTSGLVPEVELAIPEALITQVEAGSAVRVTFDALPGRELAGVVSEVGVSATGTATTFPVRVRLVRPEPLVRPGMAAEVRVDFPGAGEAGRFLLPSEAVGEDREGRFVFVVVPAGDGTGTVTRRSVEVGEIRAEGLEVLSGLADGERVVTAGVSRIEDGQRVRLSSAQEG